MLKAFQATDRNVWVADSFQGLPETNPEEYPQDANEWMHEAQELAIPVEDVKSPFERFELLDDKVKFIEGFFSESLVTAPVDKLAVLRLDGDMYESTMDTLIALYPKLSVDGYPIVDDYHRDNCRQAVFDYREKFSIEEPIQEIDWASAFWQNTKLANYLDMVPESLPFPRRLIWLALDRSSPIKDTLRAPQTPSGFVEPGLPQLTLRRSRHTGNTLFHPPVSG